MRLLVDFVSLFVSYMSSFLKVLPLQDPMFWWVIITCVISLVAMAHTHTHTCHTHTHTRTQDFTNSQVLALSHFIFHMFVAQQMEVEHRNLQTLVVAGTFLRIAAEVSSQDVACQVRRKGT